MGELNADHLVLAHTYIHTGEVVAIAGDVVSPQEVVDTFTKIKGVKVMRNLIFTRICAYIHAYLRDIHRLPAHNCLWISSTSIADTRSSFDCRDV